MDTNNAALYSIAATLFGLIVAIMISRKQLNAQSFIAYTNKYDLITKNAPEEWKRRLDKEYKLPDSNPKTRSHLRAYLHLCSQEYHLYTHGLVATDVWLLWEQEIEQNLNSRLLVREWNMLKADFKPYPEFSTFVEKVQELGPGHRAADEHKISFKFKKYVLRKFSAWF